MTDGADAGAIAAAAPASGDGMHLHRPKPLHGGRDILLEIGVIVVGIIIAIGLEQAVEFVHHSFQREELAAALRRDGQVNRKYINDDIASSQAVLDWALAQTSRLERAGPSGPLTLRHMPPGGIGSLDAGVWPSAKASGLTNLLPPSGQNWLEYLADVDSRTFDAPASATSQLNDAYADLDQVMIGRTAESGSDEIDLSGLSAPQRSMAVDRLRAIAEKARAVIRQLIIYDAGNDFILSTPLDQLDTPQSADRYARILREKMKSHPAANYTFAPK